MISDIRMFFRKRDKLIDEVVRLRAANSELVAKVQQKEQEKKQLQLALEAAKKE